MLPNQSGSPRCLIPIQIETLAGTSFELLVSPTEQIQYIKRKIERREGIPMSHQHLIWNSTELNDESTLNEYHIEAGSTIKLVLAMRGGPVNTRRIPIDDYFIRESSDFIESSHDEYIGTNDHISPSNKNVTFLVFRNGDKYNFFRFVDRGDGTLSPMSSSMSATSIYNAQETVNVETEQEYDEKRRADDQKTRQKMEAIQSKLKTRSKKDIQVPTRPSSSTKQTKSSLIQHPRRMIRVDTSSNLSTYGDNSSGTSSLEHQYQPLSFKYAHKNFFNSYNILAGTEIHHHDLLHEEDSDDEDEDDDPDVDDSHDDDDEQKSSAKIFASRSLSPSIFQSRSLPKESNLKTSIVQHSNTPTTVSITDVNSNTVQVDYKTHIDKNSPDTSVVNRTKALIEASGPFKTDLNPANEMKNLLADSSNQTLPTVNEATSKTLVCATANEKIESDQKATTDAQIRNETACSKALWTDDDDMNNNLEELPTNERISTSRSILLRRQTSSRSTSAISPLPYITGQSKKNTMTTTTTTQPFYPTFKPSTIDHTSAKPSPRTLLPLSLSRYRRIPMNNSFDSSSRNQGWNGNGQTTSGTALNPDNSSSIHATNESIASNKRLDSFKTPAKSIAIQSPTTATPIVLPPPAPIKRCVQQQETKTTAAQSSTATSSMVPLDNTKVTIETIGSKTVSALLRQNATIEPVDTSRGVGKHLVSLLTSASKDSTTTKPMLSKASSQDAVIEERFKLDSKLNSTWTNASGINPLASSSNFQSSNSPVYNANKLPPVTVNRKSTTKCFLCKKKTGLATTYQCRCGSSFCSEHRYPEAHACPFDFKAEGKRLIERNNPLVTAQKLPKI